MLLFFLPRRRVCQLEEGDVGTMHSLYSQTCQQWMAFMNHLGMHLRPKLLQIGWGWASLPFFT